MKRAGYEVKTVRGGGISFRLTGQGQERFTRLRASTLGDGYDLQDVLSAIEGKEKRPGRSERKISLAVDIQAKLAAGKGPGYERWAKVFNIKQMAAALAYIQDKLNEEITAKELNEKCQCCLKIKASDTAQAAILIEKNLHTKNYEILSDNNIRIFEYVDNPGIVNSLLVNHGISVDECTVTKESLEDYFNEKMRGGIVNA